MKQHTNLSRPHTPLIMPQELHCDACEVVTNNIRKIIVNGMTMKVCPACNSEYKMFKLTVKD